MKLHEYVDWLRLVATQTKIDSALGSVGWAENYGISHKNVVVNSHSRLHLFCQTQLQIKLSSLVVE